MRENKEKEFVAKGLIKDVPDNFKNWLVNNQDRISIATQKGTLPYWMQDNQKYLTSFVGRKGETSNIEPYKRIHSTEQILIRLQQIENLLPKDEKAVIRKIDILKGKDMGLTDASGNIYLRKDQYEAFNNAVDKLMRGKANEITPSEAQATLTYWHERTHNLSNNSLQAVKFKNKEEDFMELATEFVAQKTLPNFYKMFNAKMPSKINMSSRYQTMVRNYRTVVDKLSEIGGLNSQEVINKIKNHIIKGEWDDQKNGLVNALYGAKINGKIIDKKTLGKIINDAYKYGDFQFERKMNKLLGID
jgi:hypothetical protein